MQNIINYQHFVYLIIYLPLPFYIFIIFHLTVVKSKEAREWSGMCSDWGAFEWLNSGANDKYIQWERRVPTKMEREGKTSTKSRLNVATASSRLMNARINQFPKDLPRDSLESTQELYYHSHQVPFPVHSHFSFSFSHLHLFLNVRTIWFVSIFHRWNEFSKISIPIYFLKFFSFFFSLI